MTDFNNDTVNTDPLATPQWHDNQDTVAAWVPLLIRYLRNQPDHNTLIWECAAVYDKRTARLQISSNMHLAKIIFMQVNNITCDMNRPFIMPDMTPPFVGVPPAGAPPPPPLPVIDPLRPGIMPDEPCLWANIDPTPAQLLIYAINPNAVRLALESNTDKILAGIPTDRAKLKYALIATHVQRGARPGRTPTSSSHTSFRPWATSLREPRTSSELPSTLISKKAHQRQHPTLGTSS